MVRFSAVMACVAVALASNAATTAADATGRPASQPATRPSYFRSPTDGAFDVSGSTADR
jgi:hypothetical protein